MLNAGYGCNTTTPPANVVNAYPGGCVNPAVNSPWTVARATAYTVTVPYYYQLAAHLTYHADNFDIRYVGGGAWYNYTLTGPAGGSGSNVLLAPITSYDLSGFLDLGLNLNPSSVTIYPQESFVYEENNRFSSHEITFISTHEGPLQWVAGAYFFQQRAHQPVWTENPDQQTQWNGPFPFGVCVFVNPCPPQVDQKRYDNDPHDEAESYAGYGQLDWQINDEWHATLGLRYSHDRKFGTERARLLCFSSICVSPDVFGAFTPALDLTQLTPLVSPTAPVTCIPGEGLSDCTFDVTGYAVRRFDGSWQATTGTLGVEWTPDDDTMAYAKYSRGYKSGGFNVGIFTVLNSGITDQELVDSYEIGLKRDWTDSLQTNMALYHYSYENLQIPITVTHVGAPNTTDFYNVPEATSSGFELETIWEPFDNFQVLFNYSYNKTEIQEGTAADAADLGALTPGARPLLTMAQCAADPDGAGPATTTCAPNLWYGFARAQDLSGNSLPNAPENKVALNFNYTWNFSGGDLVGSLTYMWRDEQFGSLFTREHYRAPAWDQVDARLTWTDSDDRFRVILYGKNLFDEIGYDAGPYAISVTGLANNGAAIMCGNQIVAAGACVPTTGPNGSIASGYSITPPRTYGIELQYRF